MTQAQKKPVLSTRFGNIGLIFLMFLPVLGEFGRIFIGPFNGIITSDIIIPLFLIIWFFLFFTGPHQRLNKIPKRIWLPLLLFIAIAFLSLLRSLLFLDNSEVISGSLYLIRFIQYALLYFVTLSSIQTYKQKETLIKFMVISALLIAIAGFIQLQIFPDLQELEAEGYDPHINRLVSTWLDPNFVGGFFAIIISVLTGIFLYKKSLKQKISLAIIIAILAVALFLTFSRSAYLALIAGLFVITILKSRKLLIAITIFFVLGLAVSERAQERTAELITSISSVLTTNAVENPDPTARLRIQNWQQTWYLIEKRPLLGSGYNNLRSVNYREGFVTDTEIHSASGSDSSLLTIFATTGVFGLITYLWIIFLALKHSFFGWRDTKSKPTSKGLSLGILGATTSILIHSLFVNSLLFAPILIYLWPLFAMAESTHFKKY